MSTPMMFGIVFVFMAVLVVMQRSQKQRALADAGAEDELPAALNRGKPDRFGVFARFVKSKKGGKSKIERDLVTAAIMLKPTEFFAVNVVVLFVIVMVGFLFHINRIPGDPSFFGVLKRLGFLLFYVWLGWNLPRLVLSFLANKRRNTMEYQLADALAIISSGLKGGYSFIQGLDMASTQMDPPIQEEFLRVIRLVQLGMNTDKALVQMSERVNSYDFDMTVSATNIQLAVGGNLSNLLEGIAATIRDRIRLKRDIAALTAQGRISGGILIALPLGIAVMLRFLNPEYMSYLFDYPLGNTLIYVALGMWAFGIWIINNLINFDK